MPEITIKNFKGINMQEGNWQEGYARYCVGMDLVGLQLGSAKRSFPGVLQGFLEVSAGAEAAGVSAITAIPTAFTIYSSQDFCITQATTKIYRRDSGTWTWVSSLTVSTVDSPDLTVYGGNLYYSQRGQLGLYDNTNSQANFQTFTDTTTASERPMRILNGSLYIGNARYIAKYDGTTFTASALTLPSNFVIRSMEVVGDYIYAMADNGFYSSLFIWDGVSNRYRTPINLFNEVSSPTLKAVGNKLFAVSNTLQSFEGARIYLFNGADFEKIAILPINRTGAFILNTLGEFAGGLLIASREVATASYEDGSGGIWMLNRATDSDPYQATIIFPLRNQMTNHDNWALGSGSSSRFYIGNQDVTASTQGVFEVLTSGSNNPSIWQSLPIDAGSTSKKMWHSVRLNAEDLTTGQTIVVKYRLDDTTAFTTLKTLTTSSDLEAYIPIGRTSRTIDIRIELTPATTGKESTRIHGFTIDYTPAK